MARPFSHDWRCFWSSSRKKNAVDTIITFRCRIASTLSMISTWWSWVPLNVNGWWLEVSPHWCGGFKVGGSWTPTGWDIQQNSPDLKSRILGGTPSNHPISRLPRFFFRLGLFWGWSLMKSIFYSYKQFMYDFKMVTPNEFQHFLFNLLKKQSETIYNIVG